MSVSMCSPGGGVASQAYARAAAASSQPCAARPLPPSLAAISAKQCPARAERMPGTSEETEEVEAVLIKVLELEEIDTNMYRGYSPPVPRWGRVFGGQTVAQALVSACRTVDVRFIVHSLHSYFLRPGDDDIPIVYYVERLRNGATFASRRVTALQRGAAIFAMNVSFMSQESGLEHQHPMPQVPAPESIPSLMETYKELLQNPRLTPRMRKSLERSVAFPFPLDLRRCVPESFEQRLQKNPPVQRSWMRVQGQLGNSLMMHQCALAYLSDWSLLETALLPHGLHGWIQRDDDESLQMASIDHSMWFHHSFRADEWLLYDMESPAASQGRGLAIGRFYNRDGKLIVTCAQEGLIRVRSAKRDAAAAAAKKRAQAAAAAAAAAATKSFEAEMAAANNITDKQSSSSSSGVVSPPLPIVSKKGTSDPDARPSQPGSFTPVSPDTIAGPTPPLLQSKL